MEILAASVNLTGQVRQGRTRSDPSGTDSTTAQRIKSNSSSSSTSSNSSSRTSSTQDDKSKILKYKRITSTKLNGHLGEMVEQLNSSNKQKAAPKDGQSNATPPAHYNHHRLESSSFESREPNQQQTSTRVLATCDKSTRLLIVLFLVGLIICVTSIVCILLLPSLISNQIAKKLVLKNNSMLLERWSKPNVPMYFKVWLYDFKNAQEIMDKRDTKPQVREIGPFVFNLRRQKDVISFAGDNLYYTERKIYHFNRELSCCAINTTVTIPNIPLVAVVDRALGYNLPLLGRFIPRLINRAIQSLREQLFVRKQVNEILFDGYDVELLRMVSRIGSLVGLPQQSQKFALLKGRNDTWRPEQDGVWAINTGQRDRRQFGRVASWNSYKRLPFWPAEQCNVINGSDGTLFPPPIKRSEPLYIFNQELCRTVNLVFDRPSDVRSIQAYRFVLNPMNFAHTMTGQTQQLQKQTPAGGLPAGALARLVNSKPVQDKQQQQQAQRARLNPLFQNNPRQPNQPPLEFPTRRLSLSQLQPLDQRRPSQLAADWRSARTGSGLTPSASERQTLQQPPVSQIQSSSQTGSANPEQVAAIQSDRGGGGRKLTSEEEQEAIRIQQEKLIRVAQADQLANERKSKTNPQTCFCDRKATNLNGVNVCEFDGLIDLSKCSKQAQVIFGSMPHFYNSDPRLLGQVAGLAPNASKHTTYLDIEPNTGLVLGGKRRVQLNVIIKHNNEIDGFENINDMLLPIIWFEESALIPEETAQKFRSMYVDKIRMINLILFSLLIASIALLAVDARLLMTTRRWREFKLLHQNAGVGPNNGAKSSTSARKLKAKHSYGASAAAAPKLNEAGLNLANSTRRHQNQRSMSRSIRMASSPLVAKLVGGGSGAQQAVGASSPLLLSNGTSSAATTTADSSPSVTPPGSPRDSPELRKWLPGGDGRNLTRVHLNAHEETRLTTTNGLGSGGGNVTQVRINANKLLSGGSEALRKAGEGEQVDRDK